MTISLCTDLYGMPRSDSKPQADELLGLVELHVAARRKVSTCSGGMRRRLELACGLINYPKLVFLDEPTLLRRPDTRRSLEIHPNAERTVSNNPIANNTLHRRSRHTTR